MRASVSRASSTTVFTALNLLPSLITTIGSLEQRGGEERVHGWAMIMVLVLVLVLARNDYL